jgi:CDP-diacylglycerol--serine O-phosphatidyltransferase
LIPVFSAIRLAKFNIDTRQTNSFIGVPTPANTIFIAAIPYIIENDTWGAAAFFTNNWFLIIFPFISAYLLVAELPLFALKFKSLNWNDNKIQFIFLFICLLSLAIFTYLGVVLCIVSYVLLSIIQNKFILK